MLRCFQETVDLVIFTEEILNGKLHSLCSDYFCLDETLYIQRYWTKQNATPSNSIHILIVNAYLSYQCLISLQIILFSSQRTE